MKNIIIAICCCALVACNEQPEKVPVLVQWPAEYYNPLPTPIGGRITGGGSFEIHLPKDAITQRFPKYNAKVAPGGTFTDTVVIGQPSLVQLVRTSDKKVFPFFIIPGQPVTLTLDSIATVEGGRYSVETTEAICRASDIFEIQQLLIDIAGMTPEAYKAYILLIAKSKVDELKQSQHPSYMKDMMISRVNYLTLSLLCRYTTYMQAAIDQSGIDATIPEPNADYYTFLPDLLDDRCFYFDSNLPSMLMSASAFSLPAETIATPDERFAYFKEKVAPLLGTDRGLLFDLVHARFYIAKPSVTPEALAALEAAFADKPTYLKTVMEAEYDIEEDDDIWRPRPLPFLR
jgi:hypothetical protein